MKQFFKFPLILLPLLFFSGCEECSSVSPSARLYFIGYNDTTIMLKYQSNRGFCEGMFEDKDNYTNHIITIDRASGKTDDDSYTSDSKGKTYYEEGYTTLFDDALELESHHFDSVSFMTGGYNNQKQQRFTIKRIEENSFQLIVEDVVKDDEGKIIEYTPVNTYPFN